MQSAPKIPKNKRPPHPPGLKEWIVGRSVGFGIQALASTIRFQFESYPDSNYSKPIIFCLWHNRLALCMEVFSRYVMKVSPKNSLAAMVSASKDGAILSVILQSYGVSPIRGSSSRRGAQAMKEAVSFLRKGNHLAITPDGPRGPLYQVQSGVISLAQLTGCPIVPVSFLISRKWILNSWDKFQVPKPFSKCHAIFGEPVYIERSLTPEQRDNMAQHLAEKMMLLGNDSLDSGD